MGINYLNYIQNPQPFAQKVSNRTSQFLILLFLNSCIVIAISYLSRETIQTKDVELSSISLIASALLIAPIVEEFIFRSFLNLKPLYSFSIVVLIIVLLFISNNYLDSTIFFVLAIAFVLFMFMFLMIRYYKATMFFLENKYSYLFWILTGAFAFFHIFNFTYESNFYYLLVFIVYLFTSTILGFIRVNYSLRHSILYHFIYNLILIVSDYFLYW